MPKSRFVAILVAAALIAGQAFAQAERLPAFRADPAQTSVSGLSSGGAMAVQLQIAYSASFVGAGVIAGAPYYCASYWGLIRVARCMGYKRGLPPNPIASAQDARTFAKKRVIDSLRNMSTRRIYVFSGTLDEIVSQNAVDATVSFFLKVGVKPSNLKYVKHLPSGHAVIASGYGKGCSANELPYINKCEIHDGVYDQAGDLLEHIHGPLKEPVATPAGHIIKFDQREFGSDAGAMADIGFLYVPPACNTFKVRCKVHVALHGCMQSAESVNHQFYTYAGYNNWADTNNILVLYPQVNKSARKPYNPLGCWDWWGYINDTYADKRSLQMKAIVSMVRRLTQ